MKRCMAAALLVLLLTGCGTESKELPMPAELFAAIQSQVELPEMVDTTETDLEALTGIGPELYGSAVCYCLLEGASPDEIIIVRCRDEGAATTVRACLDKRLAYKQESGQRYLTEFQPMLQDGAVRRDGLTVSLIVSERVEEIERVYDSLGR